MSEFTPITTQEEFDKAIKSRLAQKDRELEEKLKDFLSPAKVSELKKDYEAKLVESNNRVKEAEEKLKLNEKTVSELTKRAETAEFKVLKNKVAYEHKLPMELAERLVGENEEDLNKDAETLSSIVGSGSTPPLYTRETGTSGHAGDNTQTAAMMQLLGQITGKT